ncbi:MAG: hypothetical protein IPN08_19165 [Bacteroidales bacterium]|nr:hypothetical protein [Bacteroidales bacterium]
MANRSRIKKMIPALILILAMVHPAFAQPYRIREQWYIGAKVGMVSFFGDLSIHDFDPVSKFTDESDLAWGILAGKSLNRIFDLKVSLISGAMKGSNPSMDMYFSNRFSEISTGTSIDITRLIWPQTVSRFHVTAELAFGGITYRSIKYRQSDDTYLSSVGYTSSREVTGSAKTAIVFPMGIGAGYRVSNHWVISAELLYRLHNTDLLDSQVGSTGISDRYSYTSIGLIYILFPVNQNRIKADECPRWY